MVGKQVPNIHLVYIIFLSVGLISGCSLFKGSTTEQVGTVEIDSLEVVEEDVPFRPYAEVITSEAVTDDGLFSTHQIGEDVYFEIPDSLLGREMLLVSRVARTPTNAGYGGQKANTQVIRWERQFDKILLRIVQHENVADEDQPIYEAVRNANFEPIIAAFDIEALSEDGPGTVIEVTSLYTTDIPVFGLQQQRRDRYRVRRLDRDRTFISKVKSYPRNIEVRHILTYEAADPPSNSSTGTVSVEMNQSMILLPENPMMPRLYDERVGYYSIQQTNYGLDEQRAAERRYITRWRLEPSDEDAFNRGILVEPKKPIVYYIDPATPEKWRPYLKQGVEDWNRAFEAAGFRNAVIARDPPTLEEDPEFSPEDVRYSVIRYLPSAISNASGPHVHDPRTGEILESDIQWYHNIMNLLRNWFFVQTAVSNHDARGVRFEDEVMGRLIRVVIAHEVGHTLGLPHNWGSSYAYPVDSLRSRTFTDSHGTAPSIMDYARFNYIAQPEDRVENFFPDLGEYDYYAINWGYRPILGVQSPEEERLTLHRWIIDKADDPRYFFGQASSDVMDPRSQREDLGDDAVLASTYGLENLKHLIPNLVVWTEEIGKNYEDLEELYGNIITQWNRYLGHVARNIGGSYETHKTYDEQGTVYVPVPPDKQREAMGFILEHGFERPDWALHENILRRVERSGSLERIRNVQTGVLDLILHPDRLNNLIETEAMSESSQEVYPTAEVFEDLRNGIWSELRRGQTVNAFRRNLQRGHVERLGWLLEHEDDDVHQSDIKAYARDELETLQRQLRVTGGAGTVTRLHYQDIMARIEELLEP